MERSIILTNEQIKNKTRRIAYQIYEANCNEKEIIIAPNKLADKKFTDEKTIEQQ